MAIYSTLRNGIQSFVYKVIDPGVRAAVKMGITPNVVTTLGMLGNVLGAAILVYAALYHDHADYSLVGWAGVVIIVSSIMDMVDGYMARTTNSCTTFGAFYDSVLDRYSELLTLSGLAFYFMHIDLPWASIFAFLSLIGSIMVSYVRARAEGLNLECKVGLMQRPERIVVTILGMLLTGFLQGVVGFDSIWFVVGGQVMVAFFANVTAFHRIIHVKNQLHE
ncbi:MAG: CDP-alcohol phosphatidyltransferase family protein [Bacteroidaceae bacterium]